jgi:membrane protein YqaA with SNARE-associated domain
VRGRPGLRYTCGRTRNFTHRAAPSAGKRASRLIATFLTTFAVCLLSSVVPVVNAEIYLLAASAIAPPRLVPALIIGAALAQMVGKSLLYYGGRGALRLPSVRLRRMVESVQQRYQTGTAAPALGGTVVLASAGVGLPPFYVVSIACGIFRVPYPHFLLLGLVGMLARFTVVVLAPQVAKVIAG